MALDHSDRIDRLALLDVIPTSEAFRRADGRFALTFWPWWLLAQPEPLPERLIMGDPEIVVDNALGGMGLGVSGLTAVRPGWPDLASFPAGEGCGFGVRLPVARMQRRPGHDS